MYCLALNKDKMECNCYYQRSWRWYSNIKLLLDLYGNNIDSIFRRNFQLFL